MPKQEQPLPIDQGFAPSSRDLRWADTHTQLKKDNLHPHLAEILIGTVVIGLPVCGLLIGLLNKFAPLIK